MQPLDETIDNDELTARRLDPFAHAGSLGHFVSVQNSLWANYAVITGVLFGVGVNTDPSIARVFIAVAFLAFSMGNLVLIRQTCAALVALSERALELASDVPPLAKPTGAWKLIGARSAAVPERWHWLHRLANTPNRSTVYHVIIDLCVLTVLLKPIWFGAW